jgi:hypothetical protein
MMAIGRGRAFLKKGKSCGMRTYAMLNTAAQVAAAMVLRN